MKQQTAYERMNRCEHVVNDGMLLTYAELISRNQSPGRRTVSQQHHKSNIRNGFSCVSIRVCMA